jgi:Glycoside hydrolase family 44
VSGTPVELRQRLYERFTRVLIVVCAHFVILPATPAWSQVQFTINSQQNVTAISPYIYGANSSAITNATNQRLGGNRWTAYNWENNDSNAGSDFNFQNDGFLSSSTTPGAAVLPAIQSAASKGQALLLTIPMNGYVSADRLGNGDVRYPNGNTSQAQLPQSTVLATRFVPEYPAKPGGPASFSLTPSTTDGAVYQDEFVNWVNHKTAPGQQVFYDLDNEPDLWSSTHAEVHPTASTYQEIVNDSIAYATAIKAVSPNSMVFGGVNYGWQGYVQLQSATKDSSITNTILNFQASYLKQMHAADLAAGHRLVDVLDMHWYPEAQGTNGIRIINNDTSAATVAARVQAARSLWDPSYIESSWITQDSLPFQPSSTPAQFKTNAIQLLPREQSLINQYDPGMKLSISEYNYGAGNHISGGVAEADALGVYGQQGVFSANWWPDGAANDNFTNSAFNMYLNYDGKGSKFGNNSILAATNNIASTAVYASQDAGNPNRMVVVMINRTNSAVTTNLSISNSQSLSLADAYQLAGSSATISHVVFNPASPQWQWLGTNSLSYNLPALSVTTLALVKPQLGDFNLDGLVNNADLQAMLDAEKNLPAYEAAHNLTDANVLLLGDFNSDGAVNSADIGLMINALSKATGTVQGVPEPASLRLLATGVIGLILMRGKAKLPRRYLIPWFARS